jgi:glycosyltransferase involved in cell wall biosynthesis
MEAMVRGGAESLIVEHARCAGNGVEVSVCALNREGPALVAAEAAGARIVRLPRPAGFAPLRPLARVRALARRMRDGHIDVVNGHNPTGSLYATLAGALAGVPVIVRTEHSLHYRGRHSIFYPIIEAALTLIQRRVVCVCQAVLESHARRLPWAAGRFVAVANGVSPAPPTRARGDVRAELGLSGTDEVVITVGSLTSQKAQHVLIEAFARALATRPRARLVIAGEGPLRAALEGRIASLGIGDRVRMPGPREDVADLMVAADLFVLSSVREGLPITLLEAMRAGRPAVVTRIGGMPEAVEEGRTGTVVDAEDPAAMGDAIARMLADPEALRTMGAAAEARWRERYTAARMVAETERLYRGSQPGGAGAGHRTGAPHAAP